MARILVVDDEEGIRRILRQVLEYEGHEVRTAGGGGEAISHYTEMRPDLTFLDVKMARMDGLEVLDRVREQDPNAVVVMISGHGTIETAVEATRRGAYDFLEKPLDTDRLLLTIRNALQQRGLEQENARLRDEIESHYEIVGNSYPIRTLLDRIEKVAPTDARVLITGENGTGKELVARAIHRLSARSETSFVEVNCAAIPSELIESELFGHMRGSFTGAHADRAGKFEQAHGGTLFLDEIGDMSLAAQAKVLRALQDGYITRVGGERPIRVDVRVIAATNKNLEKEIEEGRFREDLYFRLNVVPIHVPPLRERREDIAMLVRYFAERATAEQRLPARYLSADAVDRLGRMDWAGNVRELRNTVERLLILARGTEVTAADVERLGGGAATADVHAGDLLAADTFASFKERAERAFILQKLRENDWNVSETARTIDMPRSNLYKKIEKFNLIREDRRRPQRAAEVLMAQQFRNYIGGKWTEPATGAYFENRNPANAADLIGLWPRSSAQDLQRAVESASRGFRTWRATPAPVRGDVLRRTGDLLAARKDEIARAMTREMGKVLDETAGDVQEGIDTAFYAGSEGRRLFGHTVPSELKRKWAMSYRLPIGVCGLITPFNFPLAIPTWKMFPALVCGNAVILKPAEDVPHTATLLVEILLEAGLPPEVVQLVHGPGEEVGAALVEHPGVPAISFTGSTTTGASIGAVCGRMHKRLSLEMGGKNAQIVMDDADLDLAIDGVLWGAFGTTGQRCTATSRLLLQDPIHDPFVERLVERAQRLRLGDGQDPHTEVGPLINEQALQKVCSYVEIARNEGDEVLCGGRRASGVGLDDGFFFEPTILRGVRPGSRLACEEVFGPVLSVIRFGDLDEAIRINNEVPYGLSSSIYTCDVLASFRALDELETGITYVNAPTIGAEAHLPFGGVKQTGNGHREGGWQVYDFYSETKVGYVDYSGKLQRAQIDTYDAAPY